MKEVSAAADDATRERSRLASALTQVAETEGVPCVPWPSPSKPHAIAVESPCKGKFRSGLLPPG